MANSFDDAASEWDTKPHRVEMAKAVGEAVVRVVHPTRGMDVLDYGCGTGILSSYLLPNVRSVTAVDSSPGMLRVLEEKIEAAGLQNIETMSLDLQQDTPPDKRFHLIVSCMVMHHLADLNTVLSAFYRMLLPGGVLALADLDTEPGTFHGSKMDEGVHHHGFDRREFMDRLYDLGLIDVCETTAHVMPRTIETGETVDFPIFLIVAHRDWNHR